MTSTHPIDKKRRRYPFTACIAVAGLLIGGCLGCKNKAGATAAGGACAKDQEGKTSCTPDGKSERTCTSGAYVVSSPCRGPDGCRTQGDSTVCDVSVAEVGDSCGKLTGGTYACTGDTKALLVCKDGEFQVDEKCADGKSCHIVGDRAGCLDGAGAVAMAKGPVIPDDIRGTWTSCDVKDCARVKMVFAEKSIVIRGSGGGEECVSDNATVKTVATDGPVTKITHSGLKSSMWEMGILKEGESLSLSGADTFAGSYAKGDRECKPRPSVADAAAGKAGVGEGAEVAPDGPRAIFPAVVAKFIAMTEIQQQAFAEGFQGTVLSGRGKVFEVEECGFTDDSERWGRDCHKVVLDSVAPRVCLYFGSKDTDTIAKYHKGQSISFKDCVAVSIKNWGFWSTATCDMP